MRSNPDLDFGGQKVYIGLDVHLKSWKVAIELENISQKPFHQEPNPKQLHQHLVKRYPNAEYECVYEAGFCGYWIRDQLEELGIKCLVVHPADVPTSDKEKRQKSDRLDSIKLAKSLKRGDLTGIHIPSPTRRRDRSIVRNREKISRDRRRVRNRIKSHFHFYGLPLPDGTSNRQRWSKKYIERLKAVAEQNQDITLKQLIEQYLFLQQLELDAIRQLRKLAKSDYYRSKVELLTSIPGVGLLTSILFIVEIGDIGRFQKLDHLCAYIGLIPDTRSSGERTWIGGMTHRGNRQLKTALIESSWMAIRKDPALALSYETWIRKKGNAQKVIVKIARKLLNRIRFVLLKGEPYQLGVTR